MYNNVFNQPLDQWDVSSVTSINSMFVANSGQFNQDISMWDVSNIISADDFVSFGQNRFNHSSDLFKNSDPLYFTKVLNLSNTNFFTALGSPSSTTTSYGGVTYKMMNYNPNINRLINDGSLLPI